MTHMHVNLKVNGREVEVRAEPRTLLIHLLREHLDLDRPATSAATPDTAAPAPWIWTDAR